jgi:hypothetical protein
VVKVEMTNAMPTDWVEACQTRRLAVPGRSKALTLALSILRTRGLL